MTAIAITHRPVLLQETLEALKVQAGGWYIDATVGEGGHAEAILERCLPGGRLLGLDRDPAALAAARQRLSPFGDAVTLIHGDFEHLENLAQANGFPQAQGILFDLGLSARHLEDPQRGFSFQQEGPLDMRLDPSQNLTAAHLVNQLPEPELAVLLRRFGEEPRAKRVARAIVTNRPLHTTTQLAAVVARAVGLSGSHHPATRTFLALRLVINWELEKLRAALPQALHLLGPGGRLAVITFHSLEDRIVKVFFHRESRGCLCSPEIPVCRCGHTPTLWLVSKKGIVPTAEERLRNPRCRSARLRVAERL